MPPWRKKPLCKDYGNRPLSISKPYVEIDKWKAAVVGCGMFDAHKGWVRDSLLRSAGLALLVLGWLLMRWLFHTPDLHRHHDPSLAELAAAALSFLCLSAAALLITLGEHVFDRVEISERWTRHPLSSSQDRAAKSPPALLVMPDKDFIATISRTAADETAIRRVSIPWSVGGGNANR